MNVSEWIAIGGFAVTIIGGGVAWLVRLERRFAGALTREEHNRICCERNERVEKSIDDVRTQLEGIQTTVTGTHRRIDDLYRDLIGRGGGR